MTPSLSENVCKDIDLFRLDFKLNTENVSVE